MSLGVAQCNIKIRLLYIDSGLEILFSSPILVWTLVPVSDWQTQRSLSTPGRQLLHGETLLFITSAIVATAAEAGSGFTLRETCLATEIKQSFYETDHFTLCKAS